MNKQATVGGVIFASLIALYGFAQPILNKQFDWALPALPISSETGHANARSPVDSLAAQTEDKPTAPEPAAAGKADAKANATKPGPLAGRVLKPAPLPAKEVSGGTGALQNSGKPIASKPADVKEPESAKVSPTTEDDRSLRFGLLKDLGGQRYVSPAGLLYTPGSAEGHRLDHLERHTIDDPSRPGKHGVFDGGMPGALKTIDRAYERAKAGQKTTKEMDEGRVIYTVDMGGRVGYIGGQDGNRQKKPMARRVRIVLDQQRVITAYPL